MAWTTIQDAPETIDEEIATFAGTVTSIDAFSVAAHGQNRVTAVIQYTA